MGQYKVPQDVEAEDKIFGPLTLKQFLYAVGGVIWAFASWALFHAVLPLLLIVGIPPTFLLLLLGLYRRQDQPFETYFISLVGYIGRPRQRVWQKDEVVEGLKVEPPKQKVVEQTQRDPGEVRSQLEHLTQVMDTRGWSAKEAAVQEPMHTLELDTADRLFLPEQQPAPRVAAEVQPADDMLDMEQNPAARNLGALIQNHTQSLRDQALAKMRVPVAKSTAIHDVKSEHPLAQPGREARNKNHEQAGAAAPANPVAASTPAQSSAPSAGDPDSAKASPGEPSRHRDEVSVGGMTTNPFDAILKLAMEESDLKVSQIAAQASRQATLTEGQPVSVKNAAQQPNPSPAGQ